MASLASFGARAGKDLMWYARDNKLTPAEAAASAKEEIERVKQEEEDAIRVCQLILAGAFGEQMKFSFLCLGT